VRLDRMSDLFSDPAAVLDDVYRWGRPDFDAQELFDRIERFVVNGLHREILRFDPPGGPRVLEAGIFNLVLDDLATPPGLLGSLRFPAERDVENLYEFTDPWALRVAIGARFAAGLNFAIGPPFDIDLRPPTGSAEISADLTFGAESTDPILLFGQTTGTRLEARRVNAVFGLQLAPGPDGIRGEPNIGAEVRGGRLLLDLGDGDGFITSVVGDDPIEAPFEFGIDWRPSRGVVVDGGAGVELAFRTVVELGPLRIDALFLRLAFSTDVPITVGLATSFTTRLGPLAAVVERIGARAELTTADDQDGNLGPLDLAFRFEPPSGIGLSVDGGGFTGGGFLSFEPELQRYAGVLELEFQDLVSIKAIGLLTTRLPGGESGFSLLIVISVEFTPIQIGFGFTLNGVGGVLGFQRTVQIDRLRTGLRDNTIDRILFPTDVVANASRIISDLREVYPPAEDRFVFGPMAKLGWGTPTLVTISLGLIVEVPDPIRVLIPGVVKAVIPSEELDLLRLQVNFVGGIDFGRKLLFFDATLYDSRLLAFSLSGDMAVRLSWGDNPAFLFTVGGFHPAYQPPPLDLPTVRRLTLQLLDDENPRLTLETYVAITSNTVQFGARIELSAKAGPFGVYGFLGFDVLFQFDPFYFVADVRAMLALRSGSASIASISLALVLEGPTPWKAVGTAKLKLFWFLTVKVRFSKTFGQERDSTLDDIEVTPLVLAALRDARNWDALLPARSHLLVSLRQREGEEAATTLVVHPAGTLSVRQSVVPLDVDIDRVGHRRPSDGRRFVIDNARLGSAELRTDDTTDLFAPAQFFDRDDAEKLSSAAFTKLASGATFESASEISLDRAVNRTVRYELDYVDSQRDVRPRPVLVPPYLAGFATWVAAGSSARSLISSTVTSPAANAPGAVEFADEGFVVVGVDDLRPVDGAAVTSQAAAQVQLASILAARPGLDGQLQIVPEYEAVEA
jgi:hypothetical protein